MKKEKPKQERIIQQANQPEPFASRKSARPNSQRLANKKKTKVPRPGQTRREPAKKKSKCCCWSCLTIVIILILFPIYAATTAGIIKPPILYPLIYGNGPEPKRTVEPAKVGTETVFEKMAEAAKSGLNHVTITEEELTALLKQDNYQLKDANLAIDPDEIEAFGYLEEGNYNTHLTVGFVPEITDGQLDFKFKRVKMGKMPIPVWGINFAAQRIIEKQQEAINKTVKYIDEIKLEKGKIRIKGNIRKMLEQQSVPSDKKGGPGFQPRTDI